MKKSRAGVKPPATGGLTPAAGVKSPAAVAFSIGMAVIIAGAAAFGLAGCKGKKQAAQDSGGKFKLRAVTQTTFSETIIADRLGFFADEGIEIEYVGALGRGITQFQAIELGEIDVFTQGHLTSVGQARLAGIKVKAVSPGFIDDPDNPHVLYLVREDSPLRSLDDLPGSKVAASASVCTDGFLKRAGWDRRAVPGAGLDRCYHFPYAPGRHCPCGGRCS